jgi:hypothetical protein
MGFQKSCAQAKTLSQRGRRQAPHSAAYHEKIEHRLTS